MQKDTEYQNDQTASLKSMPKPKKDEIIFLGLTFVITPTTNGYMAAIKNSEGKFGRGATKSMAVGNCVLNNQD